MDSFRIDTGVEAFDTFWVTVLNLRGLPITTGGGEFAIELRSPTSPEMSALVNEQLDKNQAEQLRFRQKLKEKGLLADDLAPALRDQRDDLLYDFLSDELHTTNRETIKAAVKSWRNFPTLIDPVTRKPTAPPPGIAWPPPVTQETVNAFLRDNPDIFLQLKKAYNDSKNYLREPDLISLENSSDMSNDKPVSTSPSPTDSLSENTSGKQIH